jgi:hypothetical protein
LDQLTRIFVRQSQTHHVEKISVDRVLHNTGNMGTIHVTLFHFNFYFLCEHSLLGFYYDMTVAVLRVNYFSNLLQTVRHISVHVTIADQWEARIFWEFCLRQT